MPTPRSSLPGNKCRGQIPASFAGLSALDELDLSHNQLGGVVPLRLRQFRRM
jgi:hypothetical protein